MCLISDLIAVNLACKNETLKRRTPILLVFSAVLHAATSSIHFSVLRSNINIFVVSLQQTGMDMKNEPDRRARPTPLILSRAKGTPLPEVGAFLALPY